MRNFSTYLNQYRKNRCQIDEGWAPKKLAPIVPPSGVKNIDALNFFSGTNVLVEEISTGNGFCYTALIQTEERCDEEFTSTVKNGLNELGYAFDKFSLTLLNKTKPSEASYDYEVFIQVT